MIYRLLYRYGEEMDIKKNWKKFYGVWNDLDYIEADNIYVPKKKIFLRQIFFHYSNYGCCVFLR